ncbi:MAG TPA: helix-turn-helix domain-containing protein [Oscillospiraceae bacterium]|nr:helix-turn-helix domain-containing protein [Oscillospiraceae bacterium]
MILDAATGLFAKQNYDGTITLEIAKKAQISEKTLFKYFPKKQILYETIVNQAFEPIFVLNSFEAQEETVELRTVMSGILESGLLGSVKIQTCSGSL